MRLELTRRGDYAVRAMLALARVEEGRRLSARAIATQMTIPVRFLPQVMADLVRADLVDAVIGRSGGYRLSRDPARISLLDVIEAVEGDSRRQTCVLRGGPCGLDGFCDVHAVFFEAQDALLRPLAATTLADLGRRAAERAGSGLAALVTASHESRPSGKDEVRTEHR
jgi:Rrf2 family protein